MAHPGPGQRVATDLNEALEGVRYPIARDELVKHARGFGIDDQIIETLEHMPERTYLSRADVMKDVGDTE